MVDHISSQFNIELEQIRSHVLQMGGLVEQQVEDILSALVRVDEDDLQEVIDTDAMVNQLEVSISEECLVLIARRQPAASDLRLILTVSRIVVDLERIGDDIKEIAKIAANLISASLIHVDKLYSTHRILEMAKVMLARALDAFARLDVAAILDLHDAEAAISRELQEQLRSSITYMMEDPRNISSSINVSLMGKNIARIAYHIRNIGENVVYLAKGVNIRHAPHEEIERIASSED